MSKVLIIVGLVMIGLGISRVAHAEDVLVTKEPITLEANSGITYLVLSKDGNTECILKHDRKDQDRVIDQSSGLRINSVTQKNFVATLKEQGPEIIENMGGKVDEKKLKSDIAILKEIENLGGKVNFINGKILTDFKYATDLKVQSLTSDLSLDLTCRSIKKVSVNEVLNLLTTQSSFNLIQIDEETLSLSYTETEAENHL